MSRNLPAHPATKTSEPDNAVRGKDVSIGTGFEAYSFRYEMYAGAMDPLIMVDHFVMIEPTFGPHPHAGLSAVTLVLEDSLGVFHNRDSLGNDLELLPGDLYWLKAGRGAVHDEKPRPGGRTHALQVFVNLPKRMKEDAPASLHVSAADMPILVGEGYRARVMLGESGGHSGARSPALPMTILDVTLGADAAFDHTVPSGQSVFVLLIDGETEAQLGKNKAILTSGTSVAFPSPASEEKLILVSKSPSHLVILQSAPLNEPYVHRGPFSVNNKAEIAAKFAAYKAGELGQLDS